MQEKAIPSVKVEGTVGNAILENVAVGGPCSNFEDAFFSTQHKLF